MQIVGKWQKFEHSSFNIGLETALTTPPLTMETGILLKCSNLTVEFFKNKLNLTHFFF